ALAACHAPTSSNTAPNTAVQHKITQLTADNPGKPVHVANAQETNTNTGEANGKPNDNYSLVGRWGDNGDCTHGTTFSEDGSFYSDSTGGRGQWTLEGDALTMTGKGGEFHMTLQWIDADHTRVTNQDGSIGMSQRCPTD